MFTLTITLYRGCRLNKSYNNVFGGRITIPSQQRTVPVVDLYLESLTRSFTFTTDAIYYENNGQLIIDTYPLNYINEYNYMKVLIESDDVGIAPRTKYCFINSIELKNGCAYLNYEEDIWHTYMPAITGINSGYLSRSRLRQYTHFTPELLKLPVKYDGNNKLDLIFEEDTNAFIIVELQLYALTSGDKVGNRYTYYCVLSDWSGNTFKFDRETIMDKLRIAFSWSSSIELMSNVPGISVVYHQNMHFSIGDVYIIPETFDIDNFIDKTNYVAKYEPGTTPTSEKWLCFYKLKDSNLNKYETIFSGEIENNYKNLSFGTFSSQIKIENNGLDIPYSVDMTHDAANFALRFSIQNQVVDITEDFKCYFPFTPITADGYAQRKIALAINNANLDSQAFKSGVYVGNAMHGTGISWGQNLLNFAEDQRLSLGGLQASSNFTTYGLGAIADIYRIGKTKEEINKPIYSSAQAYWGNHKELANYFVPLVLCRINPSNEIFVKNYINNNGYEVFEYITNYSYLEINKSFTDSTRPSYNYNVIKFEYIDLYGNFSKNITSILTAIFTNGVRIWYNENFTDDNYVV